MGSQQQFCLRWNNHQGNMVNVFDSLLADNLLVDVTLACDGQNVQAHKLILSACSSFFQEILVKNPCKHPVIILKDMTFNDVKAILQFMYKGEVNVSQDQLSALLKTAEALKIKGLAEVTSEHQESEKNSILQEALSYNNYQRPNAKGCSAGNYVHAPANNSSHTMSLANNHVPTSEVVVPAPPRKRRRKKAETPQTLVPNCLFGKLGTKGVPDFRPFWIHEIYYKHTCMLCGSHSFSKNIMSKTSGYEVSGYDIKEQPVSPEPVDVDVCCEESESRNGMMASMSQSLNDYQHTSFQSGENQSSLDAQQDSQIVHIKQAPLSPPLAASSPQPTEETVLPVEFMEQSLVTAEIDEDSHKGSHRKKKTEMIVNNCNDIDGNNENENEEMLNDHYQDQDSSIIYSPDQVTPGNSIQSVAHFNDSSGGGNITDGIIQFNVDAGPSSSASTASDKTSTENQKCVGMCLTIHKHLGVTKYWCQLMHFLKYCHEILLLLVKIYRLKIAPNVPEDPFD
ncbi:Protein bric-a-brac 2 [Nymphon striatum]|nr:Protein bric-a-brac 2 [Nymphon striatum]